MDEVVGQKTQVKAGPRRYLVKPAPTSEGDPNEAAALLTDWLNQIAVHGYSLLQLTYDSDGEIVYGVFALEG